MIPPSRCCRKVLPVCRSDGWKVAIAANAFLRIAVRIQRLAQSLQEQGEVAFVLGPILDSGSPLTRVFPVDGGC